MLELLYWGMLDSETARAVNRNSDVRDSDKIYFFEKLMSIFKQHWTTKYK